MWPFSRWRKARQMAFIREAFSRYVSPELLADILANPRRFPPLEKREVFFALLQVCDEDSAAMAERLKRAADIAAKAQGMMDLMPPFLVVAFGFPLEDKSENLRTQGQRMIEDLLRDCGREVRIVYGEAHSLVGNVGCEQRFHYGAAIPNFSMAMQRLLTVEFGAASEVSL
jgi:hypothetical protein